jgi:hypothetical protein
MNEYFYDLHVSTCLVDAYGDYNCFGEISFRFRNETEQWLSFV